MNFILVLIIFVQRQAFGALNTSTDHFKATTMKKVHHSETQITENSQEKIRSHSLTLDDCIEKLHHIKYRNFSTTDCCFTKLCPNLSAVMDKAPRMTGLLLSLCSEKLDVKEVLNGCTGNRVNSNTNSNTMPNKEKSAIEDCSVTLQPATINAETAQINTEITGDFKKGSTKTVYQRLMSESFKSGPPTEMSTSEAGDKGISSENISKWSTRNSSLQFLDVPKGEDMRIYELRLNEEYLLFETFSKLMGYLQPAGFPSGLLRDALNNHIPFHLTAFQVVKLEIVLVVWIIIWALLSLSLTVAFSASLCCSSSRRRLTEDFSSASTYSRRRWIGNLLGFLLHVLLFLLLLPIILTLSANEQLSRSITKCPTSVNIIFEDINTFLRNTHMQISFVVTSSADIALEAIRKDLEAVDVLLGKPYQRELSTEIGVDVALSKLEDLKISAFRIASLVSELLSECASARTAGSLLQEQLREIARQLTVTRQQCSMKDRALCYTLQHSGFDVSFSVDNLTSDMKIRHLEQIGNEGDFNSSIDAARKTFDHIPEQFSLETSTYIADIKTILSRKRTEVYKSTHALDVLTRSLSETVRESQESVSAVIQRIADWDLWRWLAVLGITSVSSLIWGLLLCGAPCGCGVTPRTIPFLLSGVGLSCVICTAAWGLGTLTLFLGMHGESLICDPLYDQPHYRALADLLDSGGILFEDGFFKAFVNGNGSIRVAEVLRNCQRDEPVYKTFHLQNQLNLSKVTNHKEWNDLTLLFTNFTVAQNSLEILGPTLQLNLQVLSSATSANLTAHRTQLSAAVTKRDLSSFADQLNTVARQLSDPVSARKVDNLAFAVRKVVHNELQKLGEIQSRILYKITTLEVLIPPLSLQIKRSLSNLKTIQYFLDNQGWQIAERVRRQFVSRIESYLEELQNHVYSKVTKELGRCRPLWDIFHSSRFYVCKLIVDPLNGIAFSSFFLILLFLTISPVVVKLVDYYRESNEDILTSISHRHSRGDVIIDDEGTWATPASMTPDVPLRDAAPIEPELLSSPTWTGPNPPRYD